MKHLSKLVILTVFVPLLFGQVISTKPSSTNNNFCFTKLAGLHLKKDDEPSAIEPINGEFLLAANDKKLEDNKGDFFVISVKTLEVSMLNFPVPNEGWEAMAKDNDGFYIVGEQSSFIYQFQVNTDKPKNFEAKITGKFEFDRSSLPSGYDIEGLAIRKVDSKTKDIIIGLRKQNQNPDNREILIYHLPLKNDKNNKPQLYFKFNGGKVGGKSDINFDLSSIEYIPELNGFLILTSTEYPPNTFYGNAIWFIRNDEIKESEINFPKKIDEFESKMKAEGICLISTKDGVNKLAVVFDNDKQIDAELHFYNLTIAP